MLDIGWSEMAVIALIALIVIGPKDLPRVMRSIGQWTRKARSIAREFQSSLDDMMRESELDEAKKTIERSRHLDVGRELEKELDPTGSVRASAEDLDREARAGGGGRSTGAGYAHHETPVAPAHSVHAGKSPAASERASRAAPQDSAAGGDEAGGRQSEAVGTEKRGGGSSAGASGTDG